MCLDQILSHRLFKNQITSLIVTINQRNKTDPTAVNICEGIFTVFTNLIDFKLYESSVRPRWYLMFDIPP